MASQGAVSLDTVMLNIESNAGHAVSNIDKLSTSLANLKGAISGGFNNLNKLATSLENIKNASKGISGVADKLKGIGKIAEYIKPLENIGSTKNLGSLADNLKKLPEVMNSITPDTLENVGRVATELAIKLKPLSSEMKKIASGFNAMSALARNYNVRIRSLIDAHKSAQTSSERLRNTLSTLGKGVTFVGNQVKNVFSSGRKVIGFLEKPLKRTTSKIKQMGFALLSVRSAFTFVRKAAGEYLSLDTELQKAFTNTWRAMGAQLAPALEYVQYLFHQFVRVIYSVVYALTGIDLIARANEKAMKGWGKSAKDTLGNLQKFDDLNVVEFKTTTGGDDNQLIDMDKIDLTPIQKIVDWVKEVKQTIEEALDTGKWKAVGEVLGSGVTSALKYLNNNFDKIYNTAINIGKELASGINGFISAIDFGELSKTFAKSIITIKDSIATVFNELDTSMIADKLNDFVSNFPVEDFTKSIVGVPISIANAIFDTVIKMDWGAVSKKIGSAIVTGLKEITNWLSDLEFDQLGQKLQEFILNMPWGEIFTSILGLLGESLQSALEFLSGLTGLDFGNITASLEGLKASASGFTKTVGEGLLNFYNTVLVPLSKYVVNDLIPAFIDLLSGAIEVLDGVLQAAEPAVQWMWDTFLNPLLKITEMIIIKLMEGLTEAFKGFSNWCSENKEIVSTLIELVLTFLATMWTYLGVKTLIAKVQALAFVIGTGGLTKALECLNIPLLITVGAFGALVWAIVEIVKHWSNMSSLDKVVAVLGSLAIAATAAAVAVGALQSAWSLGVAAVAIAAGVAAITYAITDAKKRASSSMSMGNLGTIGARENGGFVPSGQFFYANENGVPEYIGRIGNSAAVANNDQIVQGIKQGVKEAIQESDSTQPIVINLGNETLYKKQQQYNKLQNNKYGTIKL